MGRLRPWYQFGFQKAEAIVWSLRYSMVPMAASLLTTTAAAFPLVSMSSRAAFFNFLTFSPTWSALAASDRLAIKGKLPFFRGTGDLPSSANGYWARDRGYTAGGVLIEREIFRRIA